MSGVGGSISPNQGEHNVRSWGVKTHVAQLDDQAWARRMCVSMSAECRNDHTKDA